MMNIQDNIKLYRTFYAEFEWIHDECVNGEHEQTGGAHTLKMIKVLGKDKMPFYKILDGGLDYLCSYDKAIISECIEEGIEDFIVNNQRYVHDDERITLNIYNQRVRFQSSKISKKKIEYTVPDIDWDADVPF